MRVYLKKIDPSFQFILPEIIVSGCDTAITVAGGDSS